MDSWLQDHRETVIAVALTSLLCAIGIGLVWFRTHRPAAAPIVIAATTPLPTPTNGPTPTPGQIHVYVCGAVARPGVYTLDWDRRVQDAIAAAGGATALADLVRVNLAQRIGDEQQIYVPSRLEAATPLLPTPMPRQADMTSGPNPAGRVDLNSADAPALEALPGIGPTLAQRIVEYRQTNGPFLTTEGVKKVSGIGEGIYERIRELISVE